MAKHYPSRAKLSDDELAQTAALLKRVTPIPYMENKVFKAFWEGRLMPMMTLEFFIFQENPFTSSKKTLPPILLSYRTDEYYDAWHVPGGYLGAKESIAEGAQRILQRELGTTPKMMQPLFMLNRPHGSREHHVSAFIGVTLAKNPSIKKGSLEYFSLSRLPKNLIPYYYEVIPLLRKTYAFSRSLPPRTRASFFNILKFCEISGT